MSLWWSLTLGVAVVAAAASHLLARLVRSEGRAVLSASEVVAAVTGDLARRRRRSGRTVQGNPSQ